VSPCPARLSQTPARVLAEHKAALLDKRLGTCGPIAPSSRRVSLPGWNERRARKPPATNQIRHSEHGGDRIERIRPRIAQKQADKDVRSRRAISTRTWRPWPACPRLPIRCFLANRRELGEQPEDGGGRQGGAERHHRGLGRVARAQATTRRNRARADLVCARGGRTSQRAYLAIRTALCQALGLQDESLPFVGELLQVRSEDRDWEGAIEAPHAQLRPVLLVPDADYARVAPVGGSHASWRAMVYFRGFPIRRPDVQTSPPRFFASCAQPDSRSTTGGKRESLRFDLGLLRHPGTIQTRESGLTRSGQDQDQRRPAREGRSSSASTIARATSRMVNEPRSPPSMPEREGLERACTRWRRACRACKKSSSRWQSAGPIFHPTVDLRGFSRDRLKPLVAEIEQIAGAERPATWISRGALLAHSGARNEQLGRPAAAHACP